MKGDKSSLVLLSSKRAKAYSKTRADEAFALPFFPEATPISNLDSYAESQVDETFALSASPEMAPMLSLELSRGTCKNGKTEHHLMKRLGEVKETILHHESTFREQLHELHRLYQVQRLMMEQSRCKYAGTHGASGPASADSSVVYSSSPLKPTEATLSTPKISFSLAANSAELSFCQGRIDVENSLEATQHPDASLGTNCRRVSRRLFDLERPAEDYMDVEAEEDTSKTVGQGSPPFKLPLPLSSAGPFLSTKGLLGRNLDLNCEWLPEGSPVSSQSTASYSDGSEQKEELQVLSPEDASRSQKEIPKTQTPHWLLQGMSIGAHSLRAPKVPSMVRRHEVSDLCLNQKSPSSNDGKDPCWLPISVPGCLSSATAGMQNPNMENNATSMFLAPERNEAFATSTRQPPWFRQNTFSALMQQMHQRPSVVSSTSCSVASQSLEGMRTYATKVDDLIGRANGMLEGNCKVYSGPLVTRLETLPRTCVGESTPKTDLQLSLGMSTEVNETGALDTGSALHGQWMPKMAKCTDQHGLPFLSTDQQHFGGVAHPSNKSQFPFACRTEESEHSISAQPFMGLPFNSSPLSVSNVNALLQQHSDKAPLPFISTQDKKQYRLSCESRDSGKLPSLCEGLVPHTRDSQDDRHVFQEHRQASGLLAGKGSENLIVTGSSSKEGGAVSYMRSRDDSNTSGSVARETGQVKDESTAVLQSVFTNKSCESSNALKVLEQEQSVVEAEIGDCSKAGDLRKPFCKVYDHMDQAADILLSLASDFLGPPENEGHGARADRSLSWVGSMIPRDYNTEAAHKQCMQLTQDTCHGAQLGAPAIDLFESATLMLKAVSPDSEKLSVKVLDACANTGDCQSFPSLRRSSRRRRVGRDFQRGLLASVISVSRQETTEDLQIIEGLIRSAAEITEKPPVSLTCKEEEFSPPKAGSGSKKKHGAATLKGDNSCTPKICEMEKQGGLLRIYSWGEATRRRCLRRQRNRWSFLPSAVYKPSHLGKA